MGQQLSKEEIIQVGQRVSIPIRSLGHSGEGIGNFQGYTLFVDGVLPGETALVEITERKKTYGKAKLLSLEHRSSVRIDPPCPYFGTCGGCQIMHMAYPEQLEIKRQRIINALTRIGKFQELQVEPCLASPQSFGYRNKIQLPVRNTISGSVLGLYEKNSHRLIAIDHCLIHCEEGERVFHTIADLLRKSFVPIRHVLIKSAIETKEILVVFVTSGPPNDDLQVLADQLHEKEICVRSVVHNRHSGPENVILGKEYTPLIGPGFITEVLNGLYFRVSPASFFQVNPKQAVNLYNKALEFAHLTGKETLLDAYCGVGTLSLFFAPHVKRVIGVESVPEAIDDAKFNAATNQITNAEFTCSSAEQFMQTAPLIDLLLINPPRKGCDPLFLEGVKKLKPSKLVYISCDPATLARDLAILASFGYKIGTVQPVDMFPQTSHVECVVSCYYIA